MFRYVSNTFFAFGVPFTFLPHEGGAGPPPPPPPPKTKIEPVQEKSEHEISWPNIIRIDHVYKPKLALNWDNVRSLEIDPYESITEAELAAIIAGKANHANGLINHILVIVSMIVAGKQVKPAFWINQIWLNHL